MELLKTKAGIAPVHVPYPGNPQIITAMLGGQVQLALLPPALSAAQVRGGKLRAIGASSTGRSPVAAEVPSLSEIGVKDYQLGNLERGGRPRLDARGCGQQAVGPGQ